MQQTTHQKRRRHRILSVMTAALVAAPGATGIALADGQKPEVRPVQRAKPSPTGKVRDARSSPTRRATSNATRGSRDSGSRGSGARQGHRGSRHHGGDRHHRTHRTGRRHHHGGVRVGLHLGHHYPYYHGRYYPYYRYGYHYPYYPYYPFYYGGDYDQRTFGALDLNVRPKDTQVFIDGNYVGTAGQFDGFPRYLWLEEGSYELVFYLPGYGTLRRDYGIYPGVVIKVKEQMVLGESVPVEELISPQARARDLARRESWEDEGGSAYGGSSGGGSAYGAGPTTQLPPQTSGEPAPEPGPRRSLDARGEPARLRLSVRPADASVYLDGDFIGLGKEIEEIWGGLLISPGVRRVQIVHPGYPNREETVTVEPGEEVSLEIDLGEG